MPGEALADGYIGSIGTTVDDQCNLYVAEGGTGGDTPITIPGLGEAFPGTTGQITMVDSAGTKTVAADGIFSVHFGDGMGFGAVDVAIVDGDLYYLLTGTGEPLGSTNGIYKVEDDGSSTLIADIGAFNDANVPDFPDAAPGGNPFAFTPYNGGFVVTDGNYNRLLMVGMDGTIEVLVQLDNVVPTGVTISPAGKIVWTEIGPFPHDPADGKVQQLNGSVTTLASGLANVIDVKYADDGTLYALTLGDADATGEAPGVPFTGKIAIVNADGTLSPVVEGFMFATALEICDGDAYVTGLTGDTRVVADLTSLDPIPTPTEAPTATPTRQAPLPPATGVGAAPSGPGMEWALVIGAALAFLAASASLAVATRRRS